MVLTCLYFWYLDRLVVRKNNFKKQVLDRSKKYILEKFDDLIGYIIIGIIVGGRLGYVFFYNPFFYLENILEIFKIMERRNVFSWWLIGVAISAYIFSKK